ncbi:PqqD family protein [Lysinibacillus xylanilyticus]|uniref:PqqD family protein n=1 Tax=Lysinibacillus xylanilyticus TaxID=582475 RepID=UPI003CFC4544
MNQIYKQRMTYRVRTIAKKNILFSEDDKAYNLNETAFFIWNKLDGQNDLSAIHNSLLEEYKCDSVKAKKDLESFIEFLIGINAVREKS